jgi:chemotaxis protein CheD
VNVLAVGIGDWRVTNDPNAVLVTYALGSCIGLMVLDPVARIGGLLHFMLPESTVSPEKAQLRPGMFADTGIPLLLRSVLEQGADKRRLKVWAAGGAQVMDENGVFNIGKRNCLAVRKLLWKAGLLAQAEEFGGNVSRGLRLEMAAGRAWIREGGEPEREMQVRVKRTPEADFLGKESRYGVERSDC